MTAYRVEGTFPTWGGVPANTLTGTIDISGGTIIAMDLAVPQFAGHFTDIYSNQFYNGSWLLSGQTPGSCNQLGCEEDYLVFHFTAGPSLLDFTQAKIVGGVVVHNVYTNPSSTTYYGLALTGTICPLEGCAQWPEPPPKGVPGQVAGSGLLGLALIVTLLLRSRL